MILFIGSSAKKKHHIKTVKDAGHAVVVLKKAVTKFDQKNFNHTIQCNPFDTEEVKKKIDEFSQQHKIDAVVTRFEPYMPIVGLLNDHLKLKGPNLKSMLKARDKLLMRQAFEKAGVPQPKFYGVRDLEDLKKAADYLGYPFLLKPVSGCKSRYIKKINNEEELETMFKIVQKGCKEHEGNVFCRIRGVGASNFRSSFIAEQVMDGPQITTTSVIINRVVYHLALADLKTAQDIGQDAFYLISRTTPSNYSDDIQKKVKEVSTKAIQALGVDNTPLHPEFILTEDGPKVIEVAARFAGYRTEMNWLAFKQDLNLMGIDIALGNDVDLEKHDNKASCAVEVWPTKEGTIKEYEDIEIVQNMKGVKNFTLKKKVGERFRLPPKGEKPVATFQTLAKTPKEAKKIADVVLEKLKIVFE